MIMTLLKTSQGPARSIITVPRETTNATGIAPCGGGVSELLIVFPLVAAFSKLGEPERIDAGFAIEENAVSNPTAAEPPTKLLRSIVHLPVARVTSF
jgi:hypothetical protein